MGGYPRRVTEANWSWLPLIGAGVLFAGWLYLLWVRRVNARVLDTVILKCVQQGRTDRALKMLSAVGNKASYAGAIRVALLAMTASEADAEQRRQAGQAAFDTRWSIEMRQLVRLRALCVAGIVLSTISVVAGAAAELPPYGAACLVPALLGLLMEMQLRGARDGFDGMVAELGKQLALQREPEAPAAPKPAPVVVKAPFRVQSDVHDPCARCGGMRIAQLDGVSIDGMPAARLVAYFCRDCGTGLFEVDPADLPAGDDVRGMPRRKPN